MGLRLPQQTPLRAAARYLGIGIITAFTGIAGYGIYHNYEQGRYSRHPARSIQKSIEDSWHQVPQSLPFYFSALLFLAAERKRKELPKNTLDPPSHSLSCLGHLMTKPLDHPYLSLSAFWSIMGTLETKTVMKSASLEEMINYAIPLFFSSAGYLLFIATLADNMNIYRAPRFANALAAGKTVFEARPLDPSVFKLQDTNYYRALAESHLQSEEYGLALHANLRAIQLSDHANPFSLLIRFLEPFYHRSHQRRLRKLVDDADLQHEALRGLFRMQFNQLHNGNHADVLSLSKEILERNNTPAMQLLQARILSLAGYEKESSPLFATATQSLLEDQAFIYLRPEESRNPVFITANDASLGETFIQRGAPHNKYGSELNANKTLDAYAEKLLTVKQALPEAIVPEVYPHRPVADIPGYGPTTFLCMSYEGGPTLEEHLRDASPEDAQRLLGKFLRLTLKGHSRLPVPAQRFDLRKTLENRISEYSATVPQHMSLLDPLITYTEVMFPQVANLDAVAFNTRLTRDEQFVLYDVETIDTATYPNLDLANPRLTSPEPIPLTSALLNETLIDAGHLASSFCDGLLGLYVGDILRAHLLCGSWSSREERRPQRKQLLHYAQDAILPVCTHPKSPVSPEWGRELFDMLSQDISTM